MNTKKWCKIFDGRDCLFFIAKTICHAPHCTFHHGGYTPAGSNRRGERGRERDRPERINNKIVSHKLENRAPNPQTIEHLSGDRPWAGFFRWWRDCSGHCCAPLRSPVRTQAPPEASSVGCCWLNCSSLKGAT